MNLDEYRKYCQILFITEASEAGIMEDAYEIPVNGGGQRELHELLHYLFLWNRLLIKKLQMIIGDCLITLERHCSKGFCEHL